MVVTPDLVGFLVGTFIAAAVVGISGFAFGLVAAAIWLQFLPPGQTAVLVALNAILVQSQAAWRLRRNIDLGRLWPILLGSASGLPLGVLLLYVLRPDHIRAAVALVLISFSLFSLFRPTAPHFAQANALADGGAGFVNGVLAGSTGLAGLIIVIWASMRGWSSQEQRAIFQLAAVASFLMCLPLFAGSGMFTRPTMQLFALGLPALVAGNYLGVKLGGSLKEAGFRRIVLLMLFASGCALLFTR